MGFASESLPILLGTCIIPATLGAAGVTSTEGIRRFYQSKVYGMLSDPTTGMWHLSPRTLANLYLDELVNGDVDVPEEQS